MLPVCSVAVGLLCVPATDLHTRSLSSQQLLQSWVSFGRIDYYAFCSVVLHRALDVDSL